VNVRGQFPDFMGEKALPAFGPKRKNKMKPMMPMKPGMKPPVKDKKKGKPVKARWQQISDQMAKC
jgi:hypothetical protein